MDITQIVLVIVIVVLTVLLVVIGVQIVHILKEVKKSLEKVNKMLDDAGAVTGGISRTVTGATGLLEGLKTGLSLVSLFKHKKEGPEK